MIYQWAEEWNIPEHAMRDLLWRLGANSLKNNRDLIDESSISDKVRLEASQKGCRLWRNNCGATYDQRGNFIRYGLANESQKMNKELKSSDLIGIKPISINGQLVGQFLAREIKNSNWRYSGTEREKAQLNFITLVCLLGGDAAFANDTGTICLIKKD